MRKSIACIVGLASCFLLGACGGSPTIKTEQVTITFKQQDKEDIVKTVEKGTTLTDIPTPIGKTGYTIVWDTTDFTSLQESIVVNAIETPKTYTVVLDANGGKISQTSYVVIYDKSYEFASPTHGEYVFESWEYNGEKISARGVWTIDEDDGVIELSALWGASIWSKNY